VVGGGRGGPRARGLALESGHVGRTPGIPSLPTPTVPETEALIDRVSSVPYNVTASYLRRVTAPGQDGDSWELRVCDGSKAMVLKVTLTDTARNELGLRVLDAESLESVVEVAAGRLTEYGRLVQPLPDDLILRSDDFIARSSAAPAEPG
jgi:hypothetical protein